MLAFSLCNGFARQNLEPVANLHIWEVCWSRAVAVELRCSRWRWKCQGTRVSVTWLKKTQTCTVQSTSHCTDYCP